MVVEFEIKSDFVSCRTCLRSTFRFLSQTRTPLRHAGLYKVSRFAAIEGVVSEWYGNAQLNYRGAQNHVQLRVEWV